MARALLNDCETILLIACPDMAASADLTLYVDRQQRVIRYQSRTEKGNAFLVIHPKIEGQPAMLVIELASMANLVTQTLPA